MWTQTNLIWKLWSLFYLVFCVVIKTDFWLKIRLTLPFSISFPEIRCFRLRCQIQTTSNWLWGRQFIRRTHIHTQTHTHTPTHVSSSRTYTDTSSEVGAKRINNTQREKSVAQSVFHEIKGSKWKNACTTSYPPIQPTPCTQTHTHTHWMRNGKCTANDDSIISELAMLL